jgi:hypothetical protein
VILAVLLVTVVNPAHAGLSIYSPKGTGPSLRLEARPGDKLTVEFIHSALKSPVLEIYTVNNDLGLILVEAVYQSLGFGMPFDTPERFSVENDRYYLHGINRIIGTLDLRIGEIAEQTLSVHSRVLRLLDHYPKGTLVRIEVVK